ncbi:MAG: hypothetical protein AAGA90_14695 [Actinomycetota bacterium]
MRRIPLLFLGVALAATACGGGDGEDVSAAPVIVVDGGDEAAAADDAPATADDTSTDDTSTDEAAESEEVTTDGDATDEDLALAFAECMRDEGVDFPDPTVAADGSVSLIPPGGAAALGFDPDDPAVSDAGDVCGPLLEGASFLPTGDDDLTELEDNLLAFAECLRDQGIDVDDPSLGNGFSPDAIFGGSFDPNDPANADAIAECQGVFGPGGPLGGGE